MARSWYGGTAAEYPVAEGAAVTTPTAGNVAVLPDSPSALTIYAADKATVIADLLVAGADATTVAAVDGMYPEFQGPDGVTTTLYGRAGGSGPFYAFPPRADPLFARVGTLETTAASTSGTVASLDTRVDALEPAVTGHETRLDAIEGQMPGPTSPSAAVLALKHSGTSWPARSTVTDDPDQVVLHIGPASAAAPTGAQVNDLWVRPV